MQRLTPENPRVVWESEPVTAIDTESHGPYPVFGNARSFHPMLYGSPGQYYANAHDFPLGTRIRITAEVVLPEEVERG